MSTGAARSYQFQVAGHLDDHWAAWLGGLDITRNDDGTTTLTGAVADQAHLHGILTQLRDLGADLLALRSCGTGTDTHAHAHAALTADPSRLRTPGDAQPSPGYDLRSSASARQPPSRPAGRRRGRSRT